MFTFDEFWGSLDASIFWNSSSASDNTRSRLPSILSLSLLWLCSYKLEKLLTGSLLQNDCFKNFEKISSKTSVVVYSFWFYQQKHFTKDVSLEFSQIFQNTSERLLKLSRKIVLQFSFLQKWSFTGALTKKF